ncbi:MAG: DUF3179 domain-containing (seleno)protein [Planctomycetia bacterium]
MLPGRARLPASLRRARRARARGLVVLGWLALGVLPQAGCGDGRPSESLGPADGPVPGVSPAAPAGAGLSAFRFRSDPGGVRSVIPLEQVQQGIPGPAPRDRIPALLEPRLVDLAEARHVRQDERVLVFVAGDEAHAYPVRMLDAHELVNDRVGGVPVLVTWCPLCSSAAAFDRRVAGAERTFGVSGFLWRSDVLMYDHASETFWSQVGARAVVGPLAGTPLGLLPLESMSLAAFAAAWPHGRVLGPVQAGRSPADYLRDPYAAYRAQPGLMFDSGPLDGRLPAKEEVLGIAHGGAAWAVPLARLRAGPPGPWTVQVGGARWTVHDDPVHDRVRVLDAAGALAPAWRCAWFAWAAFHPGTELAREAPAAR